MKKRKHQRREKNGKGVCSLIDRVVYGLSEALGLGRGLIIAGFVLGFVFTPLLTAIVFFVTLYWVSYPEHTLRHLEKMSACIQRAGRRLNEAAFSRDTQPAAEGPSFRDVNINESPPPVRRGSSVTELRERFEALDKRAKSIEAYVASEEYRLEREFKRMDDESS